MTATIGRYPRGTTTIAANMTSNPKPVGTTGYGVFTGTAATLGNFADYIFVKINAAATVGGLFATEKYAVIPGQTYTASAEIFTNKPIRISIKWENAAGAVIGESDGALIDGDQFAVRSFATGVAPAGAAAATLTYYLAGGSTWAVNDELRMRRQRFTGGTATYYFDGSTPPNGTTTYVWWTTPNASPSSEIIPDPATATTPIFATGYQASRQPRTIVHPIMNSSELAVTHADPLPRAGTLELLYETEAATHTAMVLLAQKAAFDFADPDLPTTAMRFVVHGGALEVELEEQTRELWLLRVPFQEVSA